MESQFNISYWFRDNGKMAWCSMCTWASHYMYCLLFISNWRPVALSSINNNHMLSQMKSRTHVTQKCFYSLGKWISQFSQTSPTTITKHETCPNFTVHMWLPVVLYTAKTAAFLSIPYLHKMQISHKNTKTSLSVRMSKRTTKTNDTAFTTILKFWNNQTIQIWTISNCG